MHIAASFSGSADRPVDCTPAVREALMRCRAQGDRTLVFPPGRYDFWPDYASEDYFFISNNDEGLKRVIFDLRGLDDMIVDGQGSEFIFHGYLTPFVIGRARQVTLRHFTMDWARPFHSEGLVLDASPRGMDLLIPDTFPYRIEDERLIFTGEGTDTYEVGNLLEFDTTRRETAFRVYDHYGIGKRHRAKEIGPHQIHFAADLPRPPQPGNTVVLKDARRLCPGIFMTDSADATLTNLTIYHAGGMAIIAQRCRNVTLQRVAVMPRPGGGRMISSTADATHFVNCAGHIHILDSRFENQMDDAVNVHGIYARVTDRTDPRRVEIRLMHEQQWGFAFAQPGDSIEFVHDDTLLTHHIATVETVERINREYTRLGMTSAVPPEIGRAHGVANRSWTPDCTIRGCTVRGNRARGFLISTPGRVLIEGNTLHVPGAAVLIAGDVNHWYESGAVRDVTIRDNLFDDCLFGVWGRAVIDIKPEIKPAHRGGKAYHRNIRIEGNRFRSFGVPLVRAECVDGLVIRDNPIESSDAYPAPEGSPALFAAEHCFAVEISDAHLASVRA